MADLSTANYHFKENSFFSYQNKIFQIESIKRSQPHNLVFCAEYDPFKRAPIHPDKSERFYANKMAHWMFIGKLVIIDIEDYSKKGRVPPTHYQMLEINMWLRFIKILNEVSVKRFSRAEKDIRKAISLMNWGDFGHVPKGKSVCQEKVRVFVKSEGDPRFLAGEGFHAMKDESRLEPEVEELILELVDDHFLTYEPKQDRNGASVYRALVKELKRRNSLNEDKDNLLSIPCMETVYKRLRKVRRILVAYMTLSKNRMKAVLKQRKANFIIDRILQRVEIDAMHIAMGIIKYETKGGRKQRIFVGRILLMLAIECYSRGIIGYSYHIAEKPGESSDLAVECIKSILMPKKHPNWGMFGKPVKIIMDGSTANVGDRPTKVCQMIGIISEITESWSPWLKPFIERVIGTFRKLFFSKFDTYLGSKVYRNFDHLEDDAKSVKQRVLSEKFKHCMTEEQFVEELEDFIVRYNNSPHKGLGKHTPQEVWNNCLNEDDFDFVSVPKGHPVFEQLGLCAGYRKIYRDGFVIVDNETYSSPNLKKAFDIGYDELLVYKSNIEASFVSYQFDGDWHTALLDDSAHYPENSTQRSVLNLARDARYGGKASAELREDFEPKESYTTPESAADYKPPKSNSKSKLDKPQSVNISTPDAMEKLEEAEAESMKNMPDDIAKKLQKNLTPENVDEDEDEYEHILSVTNTRTRNIGDKL